MDTEKTLESIDRLAMQTAVLLKKCADDSTKTVADVQKKLDTSLMRQREDIIQTVHGYVEKKLDAVLEAYIADMENARQQMIEQTREFNTYLREVHHKNRQSAFRSWLTVSVSLLVLAVGGIWLGYYYSRIISEAKTDAETMQAISQADIVRCGDNLCAKIGREKQGEYRVIRKRVQ